MAVAAPARARPKTAAPRAPSPAPRRAAPRARQAPRPRLAGSVLWIAVVAVLLAGIVAVNVAALRLNLEAQRLEEEREKLVGQNGAAASELSGLASAARIEEQARGLGLVEPSETTYVRIRARRG